MLPITNVIDISVNLAPSGLGAYNINNVALFTDEEPIESIGDYAVYASPAQVEVDFGSESETYLQALAFFSQTPNVLNGNGSLIVFPFSGATGAITEYDINDTGSGYDVDDVLTITGAGTGATFKVLDVDNNGAVLSIELLTQGASYVVATGVASTVAPSGGTGFKLNVLAVSATETLVQAIARTQSMIFYCGIITTAIPAGAARKTTADAIQSYGNKIWILPSSLEADVAGVFTDIKNATDYATRCLLYLTGDDSDEKALNSRLFAAAYAGRAFSTNFNGSNTVETMNLKSLTTILPDELITQTIWTNCQTAGVDLYVDYAGVPSVVSNGNNLFFDQVYNLFWFVAALQVAGFNALRQVSTKIPQTEPGVTLLKEAYRSVCILAVTNGYLAPGTWTSTERFGNVSDMLEQIEQRGYYLYSAPVNLQSKASREAREAPLIQIAGKEAGAIQSSNVVVNLNA